MNKTTKILLGLATFWPFLYLILFFVFVFSSILFMPGPGEEGSGPPLFFAVFVALHLLTMLWIMALTIFYIVNVFRNDRVEKDKKVLWAVVIFLGNMIAMPIYWYLYIWNEAPIASATSPASLGSPDTTAWTNEARVSDRGFVPRQPPDWR